MESTLREYNNPHESNHWVYWPLRYRSRIWFSVLV